MDSRAGRRSASCRPGAAGQVGTPLSGRWQRPRGRATCCPSAGGDVPGRPGSSTLTATNPDSWPAWRSPRAVAPDSGSRGRGGGLAASLLPAAAASGTGPAAGEPREPGDGGPRPRQGGSRTPRRRGRQEPLPVPLQRPTARGALRCGRRARAAQLSATSSAFSPGLGGGRRCPRRVPAGRGARCGRRSSRCLAVRLGGRTSPSRVGERSPWLVFPSVRRRNGERVRHIRGRPDLGVRRSRQRGGGPPGNGERGGAPAAARDVCAVT